MVWGISENENVLIRRWIYRRVAERSERKRVVDKVGDQGFLVVDNCSFVVLRGQGEGLQKGGIPSGRIERELRGHRDGGEGECDGFRGRREKGRARAGFGQEEEARSRGSGRICGREWQAKV